MTEKKATTRKAGIHLRVPVLPEEEAGIKENAGKAGLSIAEYLRRLGLGFPVKSKIDEQNILELVKINADLGRLGGLLKLWLGNDKRTSGFNIETIRTLLKKIESTQAALLKKVQGL